MHIWSKVDICRHMLTYADICRHMSVYVNICRHMSTYVDISRHKSTYVDICRHMSTYVDISGHMPWWLAYICWTLVVTIHPTALERPGDDAQQATGNTWAGACIQFIGYRLCRRPLENLWSKLRPRELFRSQDPDFEAKGWSMQTSCFVEWIVADRCKRSVFAIGSGLIDANVVFFYCILADRWQRCVFWSFCSWLIDANVVFFVLFLNVTVTTEIHSNKIFVIVRGVWE